MGVKLARLVCLLVCGVLGLAAPRLATAQGDSKVSKWQQVTHASWYGQEFAGRRMATGVRFNPQRLTAAHRTLALGSWVRVTEIRSQRAVVVQITDRGPYTRQRGIDLSYAAAQKLGIVRRGVARVHIELVEPELTAKQGASSPASGAVASSHLPELVLPEQLVQWQPKSLPNGHPSCCQRVSS
jgi:peptidoglycan lytic transglycosylase